MVTIQQATPADTQLIEDIMMDVLEFLEEIRFPQWKKQDVTWEGLSRIFKIDDFWIAYIGDQPVGCCSLLTHDPEIWPDIPPDRSMFVHKLAVKRSAAGQGVAARLLEFAKERGEQLGISEVRLDCRQNRPKVRALYEKAGFVCKEELILSGHYYACLYEWKRDFSTTM